MASELHLMVVHPDPDAARAVLRTAVELVEHFEACWSRFRHDSDLSRLNRLGRRGGGTVRVDPSTLTLVAAMVEGHQVTAGRYDPTLLLELLASGYVASWEDPAIVGPALDPCGDGVAGSLFDVGLDAVESTVTVPDGLVLDPGGIGKGLAADLAVARLLDDGAAGALVSIGGDLAVGGAAPEPAGWLVDVESPTDRDDVLCRLAVLGGGVATSSTKSRRWVHDGVEHHHQLDPRGGPTDSDLVAATVVAPTGWLAEVHATAALGVGTSGFCSYLEGHGYDGVAVAEDGAVIATSELAEMDGMVAR